jgi:hypothetical protein
MAQEPYPSADLHAGASQAESRAGATGQGSEDRAVTMQPRGITMHTNIKFFTKRRRTRAVALRRRSYRAATLGFV